MKSVDMTITKQKGASLIEFMVASTVGIIALGVMGSLFINSQKIAVQRTKELSLLQSTNSVLQMMNLDMKRAGYNGVTDNLVKLSGADHMFYIENSPTSGLLAYAYVSEISGASIIYSNIVYEQTSAATDVLRICEKKQSTVISVIDAQDFTANVGNNCNTLFHKDRISVDAFNLAQIELPGNKVSSSMVTVQLVTSLKNSPGLSKDLSFSLKQRNW